MVMFVDNRRVKQQNRLQITFIKDVKNIKALYLVLLFSLEPSRTNAPNPLGIQG